MLDWPQPGQSAKGKVEGPAGMLETEVTAPKGEARGVAVICHPHPQFGGTKDNKVVYTLARSCREAGLAAVKFNFRGVGASEGAYDDGRGELDDALAVAKWAQEQAGTDYLVLAGFSFGAAVALRASQRTHPRALISIALPTAYFENAMPRPDCRWLAVYGDEDDVVDSAVAIEHLKADKPAPDIELFSGAGHFFHGRLTELAGTVDAWLASASNS